MARVPICFSPDAYLLQQVGVLGLELACTCTLDCLQGSVLMPMCCFFGCCFRYRFGSNDCVREIVTAVFILLSFFLFYYPALFDYPENTLYLTARLVFARSLYDGAMPCLHLNLVSIFCCLHSSHPLVLCCFFLEPAVAPFIAFWLFYI